MTADAHPTSWAGPAGRRRSPLAHAVEDLPSSPGVRLAELPYLSQVELRLGPDPYTALGDPAARSTGQPDPQAAEQVAQALGTPLPGPGRATGTGPGYVLWCGPDWYLAVGGPDPGGELYSPLYATLRVALGNRPAAVVEVSAQRTVLELAGPYAREVLAHGCALDLHPRTFHSGHCASTNLAKAQVILHQTGDEPAYRLYVRASYADYLAAWLRDAMTEYLAVEG